MKWVLQLYLRNHLSLNCSFRKFVQIEKLLYCYVLNLSVKYCTVIVVKQAWYGIIITLLCHKQEQRKRGIEVDRLIADCFVFAPQERTRLSWKREVYNNELIKTCVKEHSLLNYIKIEALYSWGYWGSQQNFRWLSSHQVHHG